MIALIFFAGAYALPSDNANALAGPTQLSAQNVHPIEYCCTGRQSFSATCPMFECDSIEQELRTEKYKQAYPKLFESFLRHTNEKERSIQKLEKHLPTIIKKLSIPQPGESIVVTDLGFGTGEFTAAFANRVKCHAGPTVPIKVTGIEKQEKFVAGARELFKKKMLTQDLRQGDFFNGMIPKDFQGQSHIILASHAFYDYSDARALQEKVASLARPKGAVAIYIHESFSKIDAFLERYSNILHTKIKETAILLSRKVCKTECHGQNLQQKLLDMRSIFPLSAPENGKE